MLPPRAKVSWLLRHASSLHLNWIKFFEELVREYGDIVYFQFPGMRLCMINRPGYIESVLLSDPDVVLKSMNYRSLARLLGNGLIVSNGEFWRRQRRIVQPGFHRDLISRHVELMTSAAEKMLQRWASLQSVDIHEAMMELTLEIASDALLGENMTDRSRTVISVMRDLMEQYAGLEMYFVPAWMPTAGNLRARSSVRKIDKVFSEIIRARSSSRSGQTDLLSILLSAADDNREDMPLQQVRDEVVTLFLAAHETTANALFWTWYLLAKHPEVETKLVSELHEVLDGRMPRVSDLESLNYTTSIVKESMRLYPPVGGLGRETSIHLELGKYSVPPGTNIFMSQWLMHRDPRYFEEPETFRPERWTPEFERQLPAFAYFPFGGGQRQCIGAAFAMTEVVVLVAMIARRFRLTLASADAITPVFSVSLRPSSPVQMFVAARA